MLPQTIISVQCRIQSYTSLIPRQHTLETSFSNILLLIINYRSSKWIVSIVNSESTLKFRQKTFWIHYGCNPLKFCFFKSKHMARLIPFTVLKATVTTILRVSDYVLLLNNNYIIVTHSLRKFLYAFKVVISYLEQLAYDFLLNYVFCIHKCHEA